MLVIAVEYYYLYVISIAVGLVAVYSGKATPATKQVQRKAVRKAGATDSDF